jgi:hypothetical protein
MAPHSCSTAVMQCGDYVRASVIFLSVSSVLPKRRVVWSHAVTSCVKLQAFSDLCSVFEVLRSEMLKFVTSVGLHHKLRFRQLQ